MLKVTQQGWNQHPRFPPLRREHFPTRPCSVEVRETQTVRTHQGLPKGVRTGKWLLPHTSGLLPAEQLPKATLSFLPGRLPGQLGMGAFWKASSGPGEGGVSEESTLPDETTRPWGHRVAMEGLSTPKLHSCLWPPAGSSPGGMAGFPASCWVPLRE